MEEAGLLKERHKKMDKTYVKYRIATPEGPLEVLEMDVKYVWVTKERRYAFILTVIDTFTRFVLHWQEGFTMKSRQVKQAWEEVIAKYLQPADLLRKQMGYHGVIMTDDLDMGAIKKHYDIKTVLRQILSADIDIALICHKGPDIENAFEEILDAQNRSQSIKAKGMKSLERIMNLKSKYLEF